MNKKYLNMWCGIKYKISKFNITQICDTKIVCALKKCDSKLIDEMFEKINIRINL